MANAPRINMVLPVGRYISGDHVNKRKTDLDGRPIPEAEQDFQFGVAVRKDAPGINDRLMEIYQHVAAYYSRNQDVLNRMNLGFGAPKGQGFSWKIKDGDLPNAKGEISDISRGCYVFYFSTMYPVKACNAQNVEIDPSQIKRGYYVDVAMSIAPNEQVGDRSGIYLNPQIIRLVGYGEEITGGLSPEQAFGSAAPTYAPPGMSQTPLAPQGGQMPGFPQPSQGFPGATTGAAPVTAPMTGPGGFVPQQGAPATGYPSNPPSLPGVSSQNGNAGYPTGFPTNPNTGQPVQPHPTFLGGPQQR